MKNQIPDQYTGGSLDTIAKAEFLSASAAATFYEIAKTRLLLVSGWAKICEVPLSTFTLIDQYGQQVEREVIEGDYIKIDIPGPGPRSGDGFDWVHIEKIVEEHTADTSVITLQARPTSKPTYQQEHIKPMASDSAHFFKSAATSTFQVKRIGQLVYAEEHGRNEVPNTDTSLLTDNIRNTLVGWAAKIGLSFPQWKSLVKGIVNTEPQH